MPEPPLSPEQRQVRERQQTVYFTLRNGHDHGQEDAAAKVGVPRSTAANWDAEREGEARRSADRRSISCSSYAADMASASDESPVQTDEEHRDWAHEHLRYEADTLVFAMRTVPALEDGSPELAFAIESWAVHVRCLDEFLWCDRDRRLAGDALATDFCKPGVWKTKRGKVPPTLQRIRTDRRIGREIVHLTYHRAAVRPEEKAWLIGKATTEILEALNRFADLARPERLMDQTRDHLRKLHRGHPPEAPATKVRVATRSVVPIVEVTRGTASHPEPPARPGY